MATGITLAQAQTQLSKWLAASEAVAGGQSFQMDGKVFTYVNASEILKHIDYWQAHVNRLSRTKSVQYVVPS